MEMADRKRDPGVESSPASVSFEALTDSFNYYVENAKSARRRYHLSEIALLLFSASVPVAAALASARWVPTALGAVVVVLAGVRPIYSWHEDWLRFTDACEQLKRERLAYLNGASPYERDDRDAILAARVMDIETSETQRWLSLRRSQKSEDSPSRGPNP